MLRRLSLIEDDISERDEDEIEDYHSDSDTGYTLVRTKKKPNTSYLLSLMTVQSVLTAPGQLRYK